MIKKKNPEPSLSNGSIAPQHSPLNIQCLSSSLHSSAHHGFLALTPCHFASFPVFSYLLYFLSCHLCLHSSFHTAFLLGFTLRYLSVDHCCAARPLGSRAAVLPSSNAKTYSVIIFSVCSLINQLPFS